MRAKEFDVTRTHVINANLGFIPIGSMHGIFTYIYHTNQPNVGRYTIHGSYGIEAKSLISDVCIGLSKTLSGAHLKIEKFLQTLQMFPRLFWGGQD